MMKVDLSGQVALVTGAARNIGKSIADVYAVNGARVVYTDVLLDEAVQAASAHAGCKAVRMDVTDERQVEAVIAQIAAEFGRLDILVNNAGTNTWKHRVPIDQFPTEEWNRLIDVDLNGLYFVSKAAAGVMLKQGSGRIINIASVLGLVPARLQCAYIAAKGGVVNLTKAMALELAPRGVLQQGEKRSRRALPGQFGGQTTLEFQRQAIGHRSQVEMGNLGHCHNYTLRPRGNGRASGSSQARHVSLAEARGHRLLELFAKRQP